MPAAPGRRKWLAGAAALGAGLCGGLAQAQLLESLKEAVTGPPTQADIANARREVQQAASNALSALYGINPAARTAVERAAGYAAFSTFGMKLLVAGGTSGKGLAVDHRTRAQTYMKMLQVQGGLGVGIDKMHLVFVFTEERALANFIHQGWEFGGQANVSAVASGEGAMFSGAAAIAPGVYLYQITETGLSATLTVSGTRFFVDNELN
ncbi:MAG: YSC84-related protein [Burkholderiales bacterium]